MTPKSPTELIADAYHAIRRLSVTDRTVALRATVLAALDDLHDAYVDELTVTDASKTGTTVSFVVSGGRAGETYSVRYAAPNLEDEPCPPTERNLEHEA